MVMPFVGSIIPPSSFGQGPGEKRVQRRRSGVDRAAEPGDSFQRTLEDEASLQSVEGADSAKRVDGPASNESEAGREDRAEHGAYSLDPSAAQRRLDIQG